MPSTLFTFVFSCGVLLALTLESPMLLPFRMGVTFSTAKIGVLILFTTQLGPHAERFHYTYYMAIPCTALNVGRHK